jgi:L-aspartate oxidase
MDVLIRKVRTLPNTKVLENAELFNLEKHGAHFCAAVRHHTASPVDAADFCYTAQKCIIATGGVGGIYKFSTNTAISTGDGIAFAHNLGAKIEKMHLIQFHPTAFAGGDSDETILISEAVRGEGAVLLNSKRERFTDELQPRDFVSRAILAEEKRHDSSKGNRSNRFFLDISHKEPEFVKTRFPTIYARLLEKGYDLSREPVPIYPCQHYLMGGITAAADGRTSVDGLYAVGECAYTGVHGNNRLASNSLLEALVFARLTAAHINSVAECDVPAPDFVHTLELIGTKSPPQLYFDEICDIMQRAFFVTPDYEQCRKGLGRIAEIKNISGNGNSFATVAELILKEVLENEP